MNDMIYIVYEQVGARGIDKYLVPLNDFEPDPKEAKKYGAIMARQLANGWYEYIKSKKAFKIDRKTGLVEQ